MTQAETVEEWGIAPLSEHELHRDPSHDPETYWRTGFSLPAVGAGYAYPRESVVTDLTASLADGEHRLLVGRAGAGKSTVCKLVADRWYDRRGPVYYADGGTALGGVDPDSVAAAVGRDGGHALVVVEDALDPDREAAFALVEALPERDDLSVLLETRRATVENLAERRSAERGADVDRVREHCGQGSGG